METLKIVKISAKGKKFAICAGKSILAKFFKIEEAQENLEQKRDFYEYWAGSASVSIENATQIIVYV